MYGLFFYNVVVTVVTLIAVSARFIATCGREDNDGRVRLLTILVTVFALCELMDQALWCIRVFEGASPEIRRIPIEIMGWAYTIAGIGYVVRLFLHRSRQYEQAKTSITAERYGLTRREAEVLKMLAKGMSNRQIAEASYTSIGTVKTHAHNVYRKLGISGCEELDEFLRRDHGQA